jgi:hypothetical protein
MLTMKLALKPVDGRIKFDHDEMWEGFAANSYGQQSG